jgi:hypothetical protein
VPLTEALCAFLFSVSPAAAAAAGCPDPRADPPPVPRREPLPPPRTEPGPASRVAAAHIVGWASGDKPFAGQRGYWAQVLGTYPAAKAIPEAGIHGPRLPNGETLRFGKVADPADRRRTVLAFQVAPDDPDTSGSKRAEISFAPMIEPDQVYWIALRVYVYDWGDESGAALFGTQVHSGDNRLRLSPTFAIYTSGARNFQIQTRYSTSATPSRKNSVTVRHGVHAIPFERWTDFVFRFRHNTDGGGFLQAWVDGKQIVNYRGNLGYLTPGRRDYAKFGVYSWAKFARPRKVLLHNPTVVADPSGSTYDAAALRALLH